jgi:hypothetical protein
MKKTIYRTVFSFEVLSEEPLDTGTAFHEIVTETIQGDMSGNVQVVKQNEVVTGKRAAKLTIAQGSDPEFFGMDKDGNKLEDL